MNGGWVPNRIWLLVLLLCARAAIASADIESRSPADRDAALAVLAGELFLEIRRLAKLPLPQRHPQVQFVRHAEIEAIVCGRPCDARALYLPERGVLIDEGLDPWHDVLARSILLHELVHHLQEEAQTYAHLRACERRWARESDAYAVQNYYLQRHNSLTVVRPQGHWRSHCADQAGD
jgi:hypothetical protein